MEIVKMTQEDFYVDEGTRGMHLVDRRDLRLSGENARVNLVFKSRRFGDITYKQDAPSLSVFQMLLRMLGYHDISKHHFYRAVITDHGTTRKALIFKV